MKLSEAVGLYVKLRDEKARLKAEFDAKVAVLQEKMDKVEGALLQAFDSSGIDSIKTQQGTAYVSTRCSASVADREVFMEYVRNNDDWSLLEVRASRAAVEQFKAAHDDLPPGISWREERVVNFRRAS